MSKKRLYSDKEISAVLKRAAELHGEQGTTDTSGLTLAELEQIAAEVGTTPGAGRGVITSKKALLVVPAGIRNQ